MAGYTNHTQTTLGYVCQSEGGAVLALNALNSIDPSQIANDATAYIQPDKTSWRWYPGDTTDPSPGSVVQPLIHPELGRWKILAGSATGAYYQTVKDTPMGSTWAGVYGASVEGTPAQPVLEFVGPTLENNTGKTTINVFYQQVLFNDVPLLEQTVQTQAPRLLFRQSSELGAVRAEHDFPLLNVYSDVPNKATVVTIYQPAYQNVSVGGVEYHDRVLLLAGPGISASTDDGITTVTFAAAGVPTWHQTLLAGNTSSLAGVNGLPVVDGSDTLTIQDTATLRFGGAAYLWWEGATPTTLGGVITYSGTGAAPNGQSLQLIAPGVGADAGAILRVEAATVPLNQGGGFELVSGAGASSGGGFSWTGGVGSNGSGGSFSLTGGNSSAAGAGGQFLLTGGTSTENKGGSFTFRGGPGVYGGEFYVLTGAGSGGGDISLFTGSSSTGSPGNVVVTTGAGVYGGNITLDCGAVTTGAAGYFRAGSGSSRDGAGGNLVLRAGDGGTAGGDIPVTAGNGAQGGSMTFTSGTSSGANLGGGFNFQAGAGNTGGGGYSFIAGAANVSGAGGGFNFQGGVGATTFGGGFVVTCGAGVTGGNVTLVSGSNPGNSGGRLQVYGAGSGVAGQPGFVTVSPYLQLENTANDPVDTPDLGGYLYSKVWGGVSTLYWKNSAGVVRAVAMS